MPRILVIALLLSAAVAPACQRAVVDKEPEKKAPTVETVEVAETEPRAEPDPAKPRDLGPPPWEPSHGSELARTYRYYPDAEVYYDPRRELWFWHDGDGQRVGTKLPDEITPDGDEAVTLEMGTETPYRHHDAVRDRYPGTAEASSSGRGTRDDGDGDGG